MFVADEKTRSVTESVQALKGCKEQESAQRAFSTEYYRHQVDEDEMSGGWDRREIHNKNFRQKTQRSEITWETQAHSEENYNGSRNRVRWWEVESLVQRAYSGEPL